MAQAPKQQSLGDILAQIEQLKAQVAEQSQTRIDEIKRELEEIGRAIGKSIPEMLGFRVGGSSSSSAESASGSGSGRGNSKDPDVDAFKAEYAGKVIINPGHGNGKDYIVGSRGSFPKWIKDNMEDVRSGKFDIVSLDEYQQRSAPGEVKPE